MKNQIKSVDFIISLLKEMGPFAFVPSYGNLGDGSVAAITYALFDKSKLDYTTSQHPQDNEKNIVVGGGGYFCGLYPYDSIKKILENKAVQNIVFLPNTFSHCDDLLSLFDERCTIFCHDEQSYEYVMKKAPKSRVYLANDLAFAWCKKDLKIMEKTPEDIIPLGKRYILWNYVYPLYQKIQTERIGKEKYKVSYLMREDKERPKDQKIPGCSFDVSGAYWGNFMHKPTTYWLFRLFRSAIQCTDVVVTNHLYVGIMAAKLGKEVVLLDSGVGKISPVWNMSMREIRNIHMLAPCSNLEDKVRVLLQNATLSHTAKDKDFFKINPMPEMLLYS